MATSKLKRSWTLITLLLIVIITVGGMIVWSRYSPGHPIEISIPRGEDWQGSIYIDGAVNIPGLYPFRDRDSLEALIQAAGSTTTSANLSRLKLYIPQVGEKQEAQKININRAEVWLLEALPGIGEVLAQRIVDYRQQNGPFRNTRDLLNVAGIGTKTYEQIEDLITVTD